jgi:hypothetical protein
MAKRFNRKLFALPLIVFSLVGVVYGCQAQVHQIQDADRNAAEIAAFINILPTPSSVQEPTPVVFQPVDSQTTPMSVAFNAPARIPIDQVLHRDSPNSQGTLSVPDNSDSLFDTLLTPFVNEAKKRRADLVKSDPDYLKRVDPVLNEGRVNFLLFGYGESHEPPITEKAIIGSQTILSYDLRTRKIDIISFTHDIRAPEIEREMLKRGYKSPPIRIDQAYNVGGFKLMRQVLEDATGLSIDFQITFKDAVLQGLVDNVFQGVTVDVPESFDVHPFYLDDKKYDKGHFDKGPQTLTGRQVIQFIKTVPVNEGAYDKVLEHNARKALVFEAILKSLSQNYSDKGFWLRGSGFVASQMVGGSIVYDFDPLPLIVNNIGATTTGLQRAMNKTGPSGLNIPRINREKYIVDAAQGDGGVQWVNANAAENPITKKDIDTGVYQSLDMEIPINANPYGDLAHEYWPSVRALVKYALTAPAVMYNFPTP